MIRITLSLSRSLLLALTLSISLNLRSMKMSVKESTVVKPMEETPRGSLWLSNLDLIMPYYARLVYFYRPNGAANFFDVGVLKAALSRALVEFYPYVGRLRKDDKGRIEINCNAEGVSFAVVDCEASIDDLGSFFPRHDVTLVPKVDNSQEISSLPLSLLQITRFKCGGVCLGVAVDHHVADGVAALHFLKTWSNIARGISFAAAIPPFLDRRLLSARSPPQPHFPHIEHQPRPQLNTPLDISKETSFRTFTLTRDQINTLKQICEDEKRSFTTFEVVAGHVWRCVCMARRLPRDQETKLQFSMNMRLRLEPPLPQQYFDNAIFVTAAVVSYGEIEANPLGFAVGKVQEAKERMNDEYMRSALDYLEVQLPEKPEGVVRSSNWLKCPNLGITNWARLPFYDLNFGWGKPVYGGPGEAMFDGKIYLYAHHQSEGGLLLAITLLKPHMDRFQNLLYHFPIITKL